MKSQYNNQIDKTIKRFKAERDKAHKGQRANEYAVWCRAIEILREGNHGD